LTRISLAIWLAGFAVRLTLVFGFHRYELFRAEPVKIAVSLAKTGAFANPYSIPTGFTAHAAPLYPIAIAPLYRFFGDSRTADFARIVFSIAIASASYALLPAVAAALGIPLTAGILAGLAGALLPAHYWPESMGEFETAWVPLFLELSLIFFTRVIGSAALLIRTAVYAGVWSGVGALLSPNVLPPLAGLGILMLWKRGAHSWRWLAVTALAAFATITPWLVRDYVRLGGWFPIRDNFGLEFYLSNNDQAIAEIERNDVSPFYKQEHPFSSVAAARELLAQGELSFEWDRMHRASEWIKANPTKFVLLTGERVRNFWFHAMLPPVPRWLLWMLNVSALVGLWMLFRRNRWAALLLGSMLVTYPAAYYLIHNGMRYEHGVYWITLLLTGSAVYEVSTIPAKPKQ
jgi:hypothetical protein